MKLGLLVGTSAISSVAELLGEEVQFDNRLERC